MAEPFLSEIRLMSFGFAPRGWALSNGQLLPINQNQALFSLLGTSYGGNGQTTFALPNLQGRVPIHGASVNDVGQGGGEVVHTLSISEMPEHTHTLMGSGSTGNSVNPRTQSGGNLLAGDPGNAYSASGGNLATLNAGTISTVGASAPHENMQPYLTLNFCIALQGIFPSRN